MLPDPKPRTPLHTREVTFNGYAREDGLWDIEGHLKDTKSHPECPSVIPPMDALIGARIGTGWRKIIETHLGGIKGCTHLRELLNNIATAAYQAIPGALFDPDQNKPPLYLGGCKSWDFDGPVVMRVYPQFYQWKN